MNNFKLLLKVQLLGFFGLNKFLHTNDKKEKSKMIGFFALMVFAGIILLGTSFMYNFAMASQFEQINGVSIVLAVMLMNIGLITLFTTIYKANAVLFYSKDIDILMSLPIKTSTIVISRLATLYIANLFFSAFVMLPAGVAYAIKVNPSFEYYIIFIITFFFIPIVPLIISSILSFIITFISSRFKYSNIITIVLSLAFIIGILYISFNMQKYIDDLNNVENLDNIATAFIDVINKIYPLTSFYIAAVRDTNIISLFIFLGISIMSLIIFTIIISYIFKNLNTALTTVKSKSNYQMKSLKQTSPFLAVYKKELKRYFSSPIYVLNTAVGPILATIMSIGIMLFGSESIEEMIQMPGFSDSIKVIAPLAIAALVSITCTTSASISLEGKSLWITKSIPIKTSSILMSKVLINLTIMLPSVFINGIILSYILKLSYIDLIMIFVTPTIYAILISFVGILSNLYYPNFTWTSEIRVIKQGVPVFVCMIVGMLTAMVPIISISSFNLDATLITLIITSVLGIVDIILYRIIVTKGVKCFERL